MNNVMPRIVFGSLLSTLAFVPARAEPPKLPVPAVDQSAVAQRGYFYVGGKYVGEPGKEIMQGQIYVEVLAPKDVRRPYPLVLIHGAAQTATNWMGTPDGRKGWAEYFVEQGYVVYMMEQPSRGRSAWHPGDGPTRMFTAQQEAFQFTANAVNMSNIGTPGASQVEITVNRYTTDEARDRLMATFRENGASGLLKTLQSEPPVGNIRAPGSLSYDLRYAKQLPGEEGGRRIVLATDRPVGFADVFQRLESEDGRAVRIDRHDAAVIAVLHQELHDAAAEFCRIGGGADDGDGAGIER